MLPLLLSLCSFSSFSNFSLSPVIFPLTILLAEYLIANPDSNVGPSDAGIPSLLSIKTGQSIYLTPSIIFNESFIIPIHKLLKITVLGVPRANLSITKSWKDMSVIGFPSTLAIYAMERAIWLCFTMIAELMTSSSDTFVQNNLSQHSHITCKMSCVFPFKLILPRWRHLASGSLSSGIPHGSIPVHLLFLFFINALPPLDSHPLDCVSFQSYLGRVSLVLC